MRTIHALVLVVTDKDLLPGNGDVWTRLRFTFQDVNQVDRAVYVGPFGDEYFKDRYPDEHLGEYEVIEHRIVRPDDPSYEGVPGWVTHLRTTRVELHAVFEEPRKDFS